MKKLNIQRDLDSRAAIAERTRRTKSVAAHVEPLNPQTHGTSEETPGSENHPQDGDELRKPARKGRKAAGDV